MIDNRNQLAKADRNDILEKLNCRQVISEKEKPFGDGHSAEKIVELISAYEKR